METIRVLGAETGVRASPKKPLQRLFQRVFVKTEDNAAMDEVPRVKELITYYEAAAAEDREKAEALKRRRRAERAEKRRSRQMARLQEMSLPKLRKIKISSPGVRKTPQKARLVERSEEPAVDIPAPEGIEFAPLPPPLFEVAQQEIVASVEVIEEKPDDQGLDTLLEECTEILQRPAETEPVAIAEPAVPISVPEPEENKENEPIVEVVPEPAPQPKENQRNFVAKEILTTERTYVEGLRTCLNSYMTQLTGKIDDKDLTAIFANLPNILRLNETLLGQLQLRLSEWSESATIGDIFIEVDQYLNKVRQMYKRGVRKG